MQLLLPWTSRPGNTVRQVGLSTSPRDIESPSSQCARVERSLHRGPALEMHRLFEMNQGDGPGAYSRKHFHRPGGPGRMVEWSHLVAVQLTFPRSPAQFAVAALAPCARSLVLEITVRAESFCPNSFQPLRS